MKLATHLTQHKTVENTLTSPHSAYKRHRQTRAEPIRHLGLLAAPRQSTSWAFCLGLRGCYFWDASKYV